MLSLHVAGCVSCLTCLCHFCACSQGYNLVYASDEGHLALERDALRNGHFTSALLHELKLNGHVYPLSTVIEGVSAGIQSTALGRQKPAVYRTAKEDIILFELLGYRSLPSAGKQKVSLRDVVAPLCDIFARQVWACANHAFPRMLFAERSMVVCGHTWSRDACPLLSCVLAAG